MRSALLLRRRRGARRDRRAAARAARLAGRDVPARSSVVLAAGGLYGRGHLWHGLPTARHGPGRRHAPRPGASHTIQSYSAPAPTTRGITVLVGCSLALVALLGGLPRRDPPLPLPGRAAAAGDVPGRRRQQRRLPQPPVLPRRRGRLARDGRPAGRLPAAPVEHHRRHTRHPRARLRRRATAGPPTRPSPGRSAPLALVLAVALPVALPHLPTRFLLAGLGRNDGAAGAATARWASPRASNLAADLSNRTTVPVLTFRTNDPSPPPLRVSVSTSYRDGEWRPQRTGAEDVGVQRRPRGRGADGPCPRGAAPALPDAGPQQRAAGAEPRRALPARRGRPARRAVGHGPPDADALGGADAGLLRADLRRPRPAAGGS